MKGLNMFEPMSTKIAKQGYNKKEQLDINSYHLQIN